MHTYYYVLTIKLVVSLITSRLNLPRSDSKIGRHFNHLSSQSPRSDNKIGRHFNYQ